MIALPRPARSIDTEPPREREAIAGRAAAHAIVGPVNRTLIRLLPGIVVTTTFTWWFVHTADWPGIAAALADAHLGWFFFVSALIFNEFIIRAVRWRALLRPLVPEVAVGRLWSATVLGMSLNVFLPFRVGDIVRPWLVARDTGHSLLPFLTVAVIERVFDILGLTFVLLLMVLTTPHTDPLVAQLRLAGMVFAWAAVMGLFGFMWMAAHESTSRGIYARVIGWLPEPLAERFLHLFDGFARGLVAVRSRRALVEAGFWSLFHWIIGSIAIYLLFNTLSLDLPFAAASFTNVAIALAVVLPQAPGYLGVFHTAIASALRLWHLDAAPAQAFAILFWLASFGPVSLVGIALWFRERLTFTDLRRLVAEVNPGPTPPLPETSPSQP